MLKYVWEFRGHSLQHCSLAALSLAHNWKFLLLKAMVYLLSEYILLKAPILPLDHLRSKKKLGDRECGEKEKWERMHKELREKEKL